jgi:hypothetical protein
VITLILLPLTAFLASFKVWRDEKDEKEEFLSRSEHDLVLEWLDLAKKFEKEMAKRTDASWSQEGEGGMIRWQPILDGRLEFLCHEAGRLVLHSLSKFSSEQAASPPVDRWLLLLKEFGGRHCTSAPLGYLDQTPRVWVNTGRIDQLALASAEFCDHIRQSLVIQGSRSV